MFNKFDSYVSSDIYIYIYCMCVCVFYKSLKKNNDGTGSLDSSEQSEINQVLHSTITTSCNFTC